MIRVRVAILSVAVQVGISAAATAQTVNLTITPGSFSFASADPDVTPSITAGVLTVTYRVRQNGKNNWRITVLASGDLVAGAATILISNVTWTATPAPPFQNGTLSRTVAQTVASGTGNVNPAQTGSVIFALANSWNYSVGTYTVTVAFTLTAP
jgi:hypothetical protein